MKYSLRNIVFIVTNHGTNTNDKDDSNIQNGKTELKLQILQSRDK